MLAPNIIIPFDGLNSAIPAGFTRVTAFDSKIPMHSNTGVGATGGSDTHTHTTQAHNHALNAHTHTVSFGYYNEAGNTGGGNTADPRGYHTHASVSNSTTSSANSSSDVPTTGSGSTLPPYYSVIYIKATAFKMIPANAIVFTQTSVSGLVLCDGNNSTPNLSSKFLRGAAAGADAGATGGTSNHSHDATHGHTSGASHTHGGTSGAYSGPNVQHGGADATTGVNPHTHTFTTGASTAPINSAAVTVGNDQLIYPPYTTLKPYKNMSGANALVQVGVIALTTEATVPTGWVLCNGSNGTPNLASKFVMASTTALTTGGATTHTHAAVSHTHTSSGHSHTGTTDSTSSTTYQISGTSNGRGRTPHTHTLSTDSITATYANTNLVSDAGSSMPAYIEAKYIMATAAALGGGAAVVQNFM